MAHCFCKQQYRSSSIVVAHLQKLPLLSPTTCLFTIDAWSMYTNIDTVTALETLQQFFATSPYCSYMHPTLQAALISSLSILMEHNVFCFGNTFWVQLNGAAMDTPVAPMYATVFFAIHEIQCIPLFQPQIVEYGHYIDDGFGIWQPVPGDSPQTDHQ
jgi:hypothetical protein